MDRQDSFRIDSNEDIGSHRAFMNEAPVAIHSSIKRIESEGDVREGSKVFEYATERDDEYLRVPEEETGAKRDLTQSVMLHTQLHHSFSVVGVSLGQE